MAVVEREKKKKRLALHAEKDSICMFNAEKRRQSERPNFSDGGGDSDSGAAGEIRRL